MNELRRLVFFNIILFLQIGSGCSLCNMPTAWLGSWYQRGMNSLLEITIDYVQTKGRCSDVHPTQQYYLFIDRPNRCTRCLLFIERHINLLQYRESECNDADDLSNVTACPHMIAPDATLYTLHRNDSKPQLCPIQPPFLITNLIKDASMCHRSISSSSINECANHNQFHLHLTPCSSHHQILDLQFVCVGTWIENFHTYFVTRILSESSKRHRTHMNNQYACFRYETKENSLSSFSLSMATDDSCRDLTSKHMSTVMTLSSKNHQIINESNLSCIFPSELQRDEWYSINRTIRMIVTNTDIEFIGTNKRFHCIKYINSEKSMSIYRIQSFTNCRITEECLRINRRTNNVIELDTVTLVNEHSCSNLNNNEYTFSLILFTKSFAISDSLSSSCPSYIGHLIYQSNIDYYLKKNSYHMSIGCDNKRKITMSQKQKDHEHRSITQTDTCLASWQSDNSLTTYLIAQSINSNTSYCLSFQMTNPIIIRNNSNGCSFDNHEEEKSISIYSARITHPCSQSQQLLSKSIILLITILFSLSNVK